MNRQNVTILGLIGALAIVLAAAGLTYNESEADITSESKAEIYNFVAATYLTQNDHDDAMEEIQEDIDDVIKALAHPHTEFSDISTSLLDIRNDIQQLKNDVAGIERDIEDDRGSGSGNFDLYTSLDTRGANEEDRFNQGETVYIHGENDSSERDLDWEVRDPDNDRIYSRSPGISQFGDFVLSWDIPDDAEKGTYRVIVEIDRVEDQISFVVN